MAETIKDYIVGLGFDVDESGAKSAENAMEQLRDICHSLSAVLQATVDTMKRLFDGLSAGGGKAEAAASEMNNAADAAQDLADSEQNAAAATSDAAQAAGEAQAAMERLAQAEGEAQASIEGVEKSARKAQKAMKGAAESTRHLSDTSKESGKSLSALEGKLGGVTKKLKSFVVAALAYVAGGSIKSVISDTLSLTDALSASAKSLKKTVEQSRAYQAALNLMGKSAQEIKQSKALTQTFNTLQALGEKMALPAAAQGVTAIRGLSDAFLQLRMVGSYAMQWLLYDIQSVAEGPLTEVRDIITAIKDWFSNNIEGVASAAATAFGAIVQAIASVIKFVGLLWAGINSLPTPIKAALAVALAAIASIKSKFALLSLVITLVTLLIDDFMTYLEGGDSLFGDFWGACIAWAESAAPVIESVIDTVSDFISSIWKGTVKLLGWIKESGMLAPVIAGVTAAFAAFKAIQLAPAVMNVVKSLNFLPKVLAAITSPIGIAVAIVALLAAAFTYLWNTNEEFRNKVIEIWDSVVASFSAFFSAIAARIAALGINFDLIGNIIKAIWDGLCAFLAPVFIAAFESIQNALSLALGLIIGVFDFFKALFTGDWSGMWDAIGSIFSTIWTALVSFFTSKINLLRGIADVVLGWFGTSWEKVWTSVSTFFTGIWTGISSFFEGILAGIVSFFTGAWTDIKNAFSGVLTFFTGVAGDIWSGLTDFAEDPLTWFETNIWSKVKSAFDDSLGFFAGIAGNIWTGITSFTEDVGTWFDTNIWSPIKSLFSLETVTTFFKGVASNIWSGLTGGLEDSVDTVKESVKGFFSDVWDGVLTFFGIHSPSTLAKSAGENVMEGFGNGAEGKQESITTKLKNVFSGIWEGAKSVWDGVTGWLGDLFGWSDDDESAKDTAKSDVSGAAGEVAAAIGDNFADVESSISEPIVSGITTASDAFSGLKTTVSTVAAGIKRSISEAVKSIPKTVNTSIRTAADTIKSALSDAASSAVGSIGRIKSALLSIPRHVSVSVGARQAFGIGGVVSHATQATVGEDGREYIIPVTKPARAASLLRSAASELGMTVQSTRHASAMLGGSAEGNVTPSYITNAAGSTTTNNTTVTAPATINVYGSDAEAVAQSVSRNQERLLVRNLKSALAT